RFSRDWSSDVCSSDLSRHSDKSPDDTVKNHARRSSGGKQIEAGKNFRDHRRFENKMHHHVAKKSDHSDYVNPGHFELKQQRRRRSEERRVGREGGRGG